jgi:hypothetical protein
MSRTTSANRPSREDGERSLLMTVSANEHETTKRVVEEQKKSSTAPQR